MKKSKNNNLLPFVWRKDNINPHNDNFELVVTNGVSFGKNNLIRLLETNCENYKSLSKEIDPSNYLVLGYQKQPIAAVKFTIQSGEFIPENVIVNPMYPENSVTTAIYLLFKGVGGQLPIE